jgi:hypothetical protein
MTAIIIRDSGKGFWWAETDDTHQSAFIHQNDVKDLRVLHIGDRIRFDLEPNPQRPGQFHGARVEYLGHTVARQTSGTQEVSNA